MIEKNDYVDELSKVLLRVCLEAQNIIPGDSPVVVANALTHTLCSYLVRCTTKEKEEGQKRFNDFSFQVYKVVQDFLALHTGQAAIIEINPDPPNEEKRG